LNFTSAGYQHLSGSRENPGRDRRLQEQFFTKAVLLCVYYGRRKGDSMSRRRFVSAVLLVLLLLSACSPARPVPVPLATPSDDWTVELTQSGGFAGVLLTVEVASDGRFSAQDQRLNRRVDRSLPADTIRELSGLLAALRVAPDAAPSPGCADCFIYELEIQSNGSISRIRVDDITLGNSGAADLIAYLRKLRNTALGINY
jgi:emfourin